MYQTIGNGISSPIAPGSLKKQQNNRSSLIMPTMLDFSHVANNTSDWRPMSSPIVESKDFDLSALNLDSSDAEKKR